MNKRVTNIDLKDVVILVISGDSHYQIDYNYSHIQKIWTKKIRIYAINKDGVWFFVNNRDEDGVDWQFIRYFNEKQVLAI